MAKTMKEIKRRLRELAADPGQPGARAEAARLRGELMRARQKQDVTDMEGPANRTTAHRQNSDQAARSDQEGGEAAPKRPKKWSPRRPADPMAEDEVDADGKIMWGNDDVSGWPPELRRRRTIWRW
ncbi:hypothetical protein ACIRBZ_18785 [Streptomyces sp. NPDC094038]|uniref:hypothetical protein n=1 Tax=Streptomyces sp. NPDC094038 TaxID=3366055 RepID=UPI0037FB9FFD